MKLQEAIEILNHYQRWRRGFIGSMPSPAKITKALDVVLEELDSYSDSIQYAFTVWKSGRIVWAFASDWPEDFTEESDGVKVEYKNPFTKDACRMFCYAEDVASAHKKVSEKLAKILIENTWGIE